MTPTQRTLAALRSQGYLVAVVEKWIPQVRRRVDLFGFADILAVKDDDTLAVQTTSNPNLASRVSKLRSLEAVQVCLRAGWRVECWGWRKYKTPVNRRWWRETIVEL